MTQDMARLIEPIVPALRRYARALMKDRSAADDLVQDCLERAIERWHQRRKEGNLRTWMFTILPNLAMTRLRRSTSRPANIALEDVNERNLSVPAHQEDRLRYQDLLKALDCLPEDQCAVQNGVDDIIDEVDGVGLGLLPRMNLECPDGRFGAGAAPSPRSLAPSCWLASSGSARG